MKNSVVVDRISNLLANTPAFDRLPEEERWRLLGKVTFRYFGADEAILE